MCHSFIAIRIYIYIFRSVLSRSLLELLNHLRQKVVQMDTYLLEKLAVRHLVENGAEALGDIQFITVKHRALI